MNWTCIKYLSPTYSPTLDSMTNTQLDNFLEEGKQSPNNPSLFFINKLETNTHRQPKKQDA